MKRWPRIFPLLVVALLLSGCAQRLERQADRLGLNKRTSTVGARLDTGQGILTIYQYRESRLFGGDFCGEGYTFQGASGEGSHSCATMGALTVAGGVTGTFQILWGRVNNPEIAQVTLTDDQGQKHPATVGDGVWYFFTTDGDSPKVTKVDGLDRSGSVVHIIPAR